MVESDVLVNCRFDYSLKRNSLFKKITVYDLTGNTYRVCLPYPATLPSDFTQRLYTVALHKRARLKYTFEITDGEYKS